MGTRPLPCTVSFCHSRVAGELICLSVHLSLHFGSTVDTAVDSPVVAGSWKLIRLSTRLSHMSRRLSYRLSWPFTQLGGSDANKHTRKAGHFHAAGELIRLSAHLSLNSGLPAGSRVAPALTKLVRLSGRLSWRICVAVRRDVVATDRMVLSTLSASSTQSTARSAPASLPAIVVYRDQSAQ